MVAKLTDLAGLTRFPIHNHASLTAEGEFFFHFLHLFVVVW
jgi:hypothetical protein